MRHLLRLAAAAAALLLPASAHAGSASVTTSSNLTDGNAATVTVSGTSDSAQSLFVFTQATSANCPSYAYTVASGDAWISTTSGDAVSAGSFSRTYSWTPASSGTTRICVLLAGSSFGAPSVTSFADVTVSAPPTDLSIRFSPATFVPGDSVRATVDATSAAPGRELRWTFTSAGAACPASPPASGAVTMTPNVAATTSSAQSTTSSSTTVRMCAWVVRAATGAVDRFVEGVANRVSNAELDARYAAQPITADQEEQFDRLELQWRTIAYPEDERVYIWDADPADGNTPVVVRGADNDDAFELMDSASDERDLRVRHFLGFRTFWWQVKTTTPTGGTVLSPVQSVDVTPSPLDQSTAKVSAKLTLKHSSAHPGTVRVRIASSPRARVRMTVRYRGRVYATRHYTEGVGALRGIEFALSCSRTGVFSYEVRMRDPYGAKAVRRGHWTMSASRCASLRAEEQRKAAAERRKKERQSQPAPSSGGGGGGGSSCDPNYSGACLNPNASDYDCAGGSGNGPYYVDGPITVIGDDHFGLDADGDGVACES